MSSSDDSSHWSESQQGGASFAAAPVALVVTLAAFYGTGGSVVGPRVAERLGVPFLDRGILAGVAEQMRVPEEAVAAYDAQSPKEPRSGIRRYFESLGRVVSADGTPVSDEDVEEGRYRSETEEFLVRATTGGGVVLGRGGAVVLGSIPGVLHVKLDGPREARVRQAMQLEGIDQHTAERRLDANDRARIGYVRRSYGIDPENSDLYHLRIDSTALDLDTCVELIVAAARSRARQPVGTTAAE
jgi:cytidylate kinase